MSGGRVDVQQRSAEPVVATKLGHVPGLDGIRGIAVVIVLLYHHSITWITGGELTVSMFFTLSGFLITRLLVAEWGRTETISLRSFYERRVRRLFPASFVVLFLVAALWTLFPGSGRRFAPWEWLSGLFYFENVYLQSAGKDYGGLFGLGNPLQHLWSLSLEEQVYLVFPVLVLFLMKKRHSRAAVWRLFVVLTALAAVGFVLGAYYTSNRPLWDRLPGLAAKCEGSSCAYYATEVRVAEFLLGAAFAVLWSVWKAAPTIVGTLRRPVFVALSWPLLIFSYLVWWKLGWRNDYADVFFPWGVLFNGGLTLLLIAYSIADVGMTRFLALKPIVWLGHTTYTIYLVHWPVFLWWESLKIDLSFPRWRIPVVDWILVDRFWTFCIKASITLIIVALIYYLLENPVRQRKMWVGSRLYVWLAAIALAGVLIVVVGSDRRASADDLLSTLDTSALEMQQRAVDELPPVPDDAPTSSSIDPELPARVLFVGDSQSWVLAAGLDAWEEENGVFLVPSPGVGCGIAENTRIRYLGVESDGRPGCSEWRNALPAIVGKLKPNLVVIVGGTADLSDRVIPGSDEWSHVGRPDYDEWLLDQMDSFVDVVASTGAPVVWFSSPSVDPPYVAGETGVPPFDEASRERVDRYNELIGEIADTDERVVFADFAAEVRAHPGGEFEPKMRPDGAHIDLKYAPELIDWIDATIRAVHAG
jgi:peptidoglycan/LPS O-acetylase OafA/YrhL